MQSAPESLPEIATLIKTAASTKPLRIILPHTIEGIICGAFLTHTLSALNTKFSISTLKELNEETLSILAKETHNTTYLFIGQGTTPTKLLEKYLHGKTLILIENSTPQRKEKFHHLTHNPETSNTSILTYLLCKTLTKDVTTLSYLLLLTNQQGTLSEYFLKDMAPYLTPKEGLLLFPTPTRPLHKSLELSYRPYLLGISGNENAALNFLHENNINPKRSNGSDKTILDLSTAELKSLVTNTLITRLGNEEPEPLYGQIILLANEEDDSPYKSFTEYRNVLSSCLLLNKPSLALTTCLNQPSAKREATQLYTQYTKDLINALTWYVHRRKTPNVQEHKGYVIINTEDTLDPRLLKTFAELIAHSCIYTDSLILILGHSLEETQLILLSTGNHDLTTMESIMKALTKKLSPTIIKTAPLRTHIPQEKEAELLKNAHEILPTYALEEAILSKKPL